MALKSSRVALYQNGARDATLFLDLQGKSGLHQYHLVDIQIRGITKYESLSRCSILLDHIFLVFVFFNSTAFWTILDKLIFCIGKVW